MLTRGFVENKIKTLGLRPSRGNGQNFLIEQHPLDEIIGAAEVHADDHVLEIGPGLGALTEDLIKTGAEVTAIEFDPKLAALLTAMYEKNPRVHIIQGNALHVATPDFLAGLKKYKIVANIPYHITSDLLRHFTDCPFPPTRMCLLIQKEVAERITALPPNMSQLAFFSQWFADITYIATVPRTAFLPAPEVDSAIIRLDLGQGRAAADKLSPQEQKEVFSLVKRGFSNPRKQLANNLTIKKFPHAAEKFDFSRRAETLSVEEWITLYKLLGQTPKNNV